MIAIIFILIVAVYLKFMYTQAHVQIVTGPTEPKKKVDDTSDCFGDWD